MSEEKSEKRTIKIRVPRVSGIKRLHPRRKSFWVMTTMLFVFVSVYLFASEGGQSKLSDSKVSERAINYINQNLVQSGSASVVSTEEITDYMYKIATEYQDSTIDIYASNDGKYLFSLMAVMTDFDESASASDQQPTQQQPTTPNVVKSDKPEAHAFVMSYCPFGLQFMKAYIPVIELLGDKADMEINFVDYIMHGETEVYENLRMHCIQEEQEDKFTEYLRCFVVEGDYEGCIEEVGIDSGQLDTCMANTDDEFAVTELLEDESTWTNGRYPQFNIDKGMNDGYGVSGSPTFVLNGEKVSVSRSAEAIKEAVCASFNEAPEECDQALSSTAEQAGLGAIGSGTGSSGSAAECG